MKMITITIKIIIILVILYGALCLLLFVFQEKLIFFPERLNKNFAFDFQNKFREIDLTTSDGKALNGVLFVSDSSKGLVFYLHGNAGSLNGWGELASTYTDLNYDVFMLDYRGYGKSEGSISSESQVFNDVQLAYNQMKQLYPENKIVVLGYSIGTGLATKLASVNKPGLLILQAPYYSLVDMMRTTYPFVPTFLLKYKFRSDVYIRNCKMPIVIFHGDQDNVINCHSSVRLRELVKGEASLIILRGQGHNGMTDNPEYGKELKKILDVI